MRPKVVDPDTELASRWWCITDGPDHLTPLTAPKGGSGRNDAEGHFFSGRQRSPLITRHGRPIMPAFVALTNPARHKFVLLTENRLEGINPATSVAE